MKEINEMIEKASAKPTQRPTIGLLIYGAEDPTCRALWRGVHAVARANDVNLISYRAEPLHIPDAHLAQANVLYELADAVRLDGLVVWGGILAHYVDQEDVLALLERRYADVPLVNISSQLPGVPNVLIDNYRGVYDTVTHLIDVHGCERIAFIRGPEGHVEAEARFRGYRNALRDYGREIDPALITSGDFARGTGVRSLSRLIERQSGVTFDAVVAANDQLALDVLEELQARGIRVPEKVAVTGFDNRPEVRFTTPPLTSVDQPWADMGRQAAELLLRRLAGDDALPGIVKVPPRLVVRQSCGCAARGVRMVSSPTAPQIKADRLEDVAFAPADTTVERALAAMRAAAPARIAWDKTLTALLDALMRDVNEISPDTFLARLDEALHTSAEAQVDIERWHDVISAMRRELLPSFESLQPLMRAEDLWQQSRVKIADWTARVQADLRFAEARRRAMLAQIGQSLSASLGVDDLLKRITVALEELDISRCYLSLYERPSAPETWARLILAYVDGQRRSIKETRFPSRQLVPTALLPAQRFSLHVEPLYFREHQLGFVLFEAEPARGEVYGILQQDISGALYSSRLLERLEQRAERIQTAAEVAQAAGMLLNTEALIRQVVELVRARFDLYYVGLFLVDETGTWARLQAGTGEAGREMIAREHKLRVGGDSMIGQCVVKQEARTALDVGQEAVRFENPWLPKTRSEMALPLVSRGETLGALTIQSAEAAAFGEMDITTLQLMADQLANAIANARLYEQAQQEIAERQEAEQALAQQEYLLNVLLENTLDHVFFKDKESRFIEVSRALMDWFGVEKREEIIGKTDFDFFADEHARPAYEDEQRVIRTGESILEKEEKEVWADGRVFWVSTSKLPMRDRDGNIVGVFGVSRNITPMKEMMNALEHRSRHLQIAADVARTVTGIMDLDILPQRVVALVQERFDLYYVGLFSIAGVRSEAAGAPGRWAVLLSETSAVEEEAPSASHRIAVDDRSLVGTAILSGRPQLLANVDESGKSLETLLLPETCSVLALPLVTRGEVIGALSMHSTEVDAFTDEDISIFETMVGQIAAAIENARLLEQTQSALAEMETTQRRYVQQAWEEYLQAPVQLSYTQEQSGHIAADQALDAVIREAVRQQEIKIHTKQSGDDSLEEILVIPALVRGQPIGAVALKHPEGSWTTDEIALAQLLTERMALTAENLRLFEETQRVAVRERLVGEVTTQVRERLDVETVLRTAADQIYRALDLEEVSVRLSDEAR